MKIDNYLSFQTGLQQLKFNILDINGNSRTYVHMCLLSICQSKINFFGQSYWSGRQKICFELFILTSSKATHNFLLDKIMKYGLNDARVEQILQNLNNHFSVAPSECSLMFSSFLSFLRDGPGFSSQVLYLLVTLYSL